MDEILSDIDRDLDVIFGEYRDRQAVQSFVQGVRTTGFTGTLYIGYPVLAIDDDRIEFDAILVSRNRGVLIFDLYSYGGALPGAPERLPSGVVASRNSSTPRSTIGSTRFESYAAEDPYWWTLSR